MTLKEREKRLEDIKRMEEQFSFVSGQLKTRARSFEILSNMCEYLINGLKSGEDLDYDSLELFIKNEFNRIVENGKR